MAYRCNSFAVCNIAIARGALSSGMCRTYAWKPRSDGGSRSSFTASRIGIRISNGRTIELFSSLVGVHDSESGTASSRTLSSSSSTVLGRNGGSLSRPVSTVGIALSSTARASVSDAGLVIAHDGASRSRATNALSAMRRCFSLCAHSKYREARASLRRACGLIAIAMTRGILFA
jgi:hypothetical protein